MLIRNGKVFVNNSIKETDILVEENKITKLYRATQVDVEKEEVLDARGLLVLPGLIDVHVHLREPGDTYKEDFSTGSKAAIAGGFTTVMDMPNNKIPTITKERLEEKEERARKAFCDIFFHFGATDDNFLEVEYAKPRSLKTYLSETTGKITLSEKGFEKHCKSFDKNKPVVMHVEDEKLLKRITKLIGVKRKMHLAHATTDGEIKVAKEIGASVEVTPHHLFLSKKDISKLGNYAGVKPPLRDELDRKSLWKSLEEIDCVATDHAPHTLEDKEEGAYGFPGLETSAGLLFDAYNKKLLRLDWIIQRMATNPAKIFDLKDRGEIAVGKKADFTIVDLKKEWKVKGEEQETKCKWSPFDAWQLKGKVKKVIRNGKLIFDEGEFL